MTAWVWPRRHVGVREAHDLEPMNPDPTPPDPTLEDASSDEVLMARTAAGDRAAFDRLTTRYALRLRRAAMRVCGDPAAAEDVAQDTLLRAWSRAGQYEPGRGSVAAWLHRIAVNGAIDRARAARPHEELDEGAMATADGAPGADDALMHVQRRAVLAEAVAALPDRQRTALHLTYDRGWSGADAARALGTSTRALEGLLRRGRQLLRDYMEARGL